MHYANEKKILPLIMTWEYSLFMTCIVTPNIEGGGGVLDFPIFKVGVRTKS